MNTWRTVDGFSRKKNRKVKVDLRQEKKIFIFLTIFKFPKIWKKFFKKLFFIIILLHSSKIHSNWSARFKDHDFFILQKLNCKVLLSRTRPQFFLFSTFWKIITHEKMFQLLIATVKWKGRKIKILNFTSPFFWQLLFPLSWSLT